MKVDITVRKTSPWFPFSQSAPHASARLFCLPYAGGSAAVYRSLGELLPSHVEVCPIELPGRATRAREQPFTHAPLLAVAIAQALRPLLDRPYAIFGYSLGALLAFEVVRQLRREQRTLPVHLLVAARHAPHVLSPHPARHMRSDAELVDELDKMGGTPKEVLDDQDLLQFLLPYLRADFTLDDTYEYKQESPLPCPLTALGGLVDPGVPRDSLEAWRVHTSEACRVYLYPGGHFFINQTMPQIAEVIRAALQPHSFAQGS
jgi:medium-chain acyl-[acyl-carrier-protein] hydrolase